ncbi:hypothetical protein ACI3PL_22960, partial [Lacticaseibacillus paracasei]
VEEVIEEAAKTVDQLVGENLALFVSPGKTLFVLFRPATFNILFDKMKKFGIAPDDVPLTELVPVMVGIINIVQSENCGGWLVKKSAAIQ